MVFPVEDTVINTIIIREIHYWDTGNLLFLVIPVIQSKYVTDCNN